MKRSYQTIIAALLLIFCLSACNDTDKNNYPVNYVGFERTVQEYHYNKEKQEQTLEVKIIAVEKEKADRVVKLTAAGIDLPDRPSYFKLTESQVVIKANQKSATIQIIIYPKYAIKNSFIRLTCTPQWKAENAKESQFAIRLLLQ